MNKIKIALINAMLHVDESMCQFFANDRSLAVQFYCMLVCM